MRINLLNSRYAAGLKIRTLTQKLFLSGSKQMKHSPTNSNRLLLSLLPITLRNPEKSITLTHQTIIDAFNNKQPYISFNENKNKTVPKTKNGELSFLLIEMTQKEFKQKKYYPSRTGLTTNKEVVKNILEKKLNEETEEEDYGFECTEFI